MPTPAKNSNAALALEVGTRVLLHGTYPGRVLGMRNEGHALVTLDGDGRITSVALTDLVLAKAPRGIGAGDLVTATEDIYDETLIAAVKGDHGRVMGIVGAYPTVNWEKSGTACVVAFDQLEVVGRSVPPSRRS